MFYSDILLEFYFFKAEQYIILWQILYSFKV